MSSQPSPNNIEPVEIWSAIKGFEGFYEISTLGSVRSITRTVKNGNKTCTYHARILKQSIKTGYRSVCLCRDGRQYFPHIHRLLAQAFIPGSGQVVRHLDGDPKNNAISNLAWGSFSENENDKLLHGRRPLGESHPNSKINDDVVRKIRALKASGKSQLAIATMLGINRGVVGAVVRGQGWRHVQ